MFPQGPSGLGAVWLPWFVRLMAFDGGTALVRLLPGIQGVRGNIYFRVLISRSSSSVHLQSSSSSSWDSWLLGSYQFPPLLTKIQVQEVDTASRIFYPTQGLPGDSTTHKGIQGVYWKDRQCRSSPAANINRKSGKRVSRLRLPRMPIQMAVDPHLLRVSIRPRSTTTHQEELEAEEQEEQVSMTYSRIRSWRGGCLNCLTVL